MQILGRVESLWRYPVKSMRGERLEKAFAGRAGIYGDRLFAFRSTGVPPGFPFLPSRERERMLLYHPRLQLVESMLPPPNPTETGAPGPGVTAPSSVDTATAVKVVTPGGEEHSIDDPILMDCISGGRRDRHALDPLRTAHDRLLARLRLRNLDRPPTQ
jgi:hypothetical protein